jgi:hypothetical protein
MPDDDLADFETYEEILADVAPELDTLIQFLVDRPLEGDCTPGPDVHPATAMIATADEALVRSILLAAVVRLADHQRALQLRCRSTKVRGAGWHTFHHGLGAKEVYVRFRRDGIEYPPGTFVVIDKDRVEVLLTDPDEIEVLVTG